MPGSVGVKHAAGWHVLRRTLHASPTAKEKKMEKEDLVVEFRQYTLHPGQREALIALFDREFVETQEAAGMRVMGQFRDLGDADRFVWMRGFPDMPRRAQALQVFYGGPVWAAHRDAANATMADSDNVLLLRPAWSGAGYPPGSRAAPGHEGDAPGLLDATVFPLRHAASPALLELVRGPLSRVLAEGGARSIAWYVTEAARNNFPRLPVREGEQVLLGLAMFPDADTFQRFGAGQAWEREAAPLLQPFLAAPAEARRLVPTARSAMKA
jgi:hypothetical protein